MTLDAETIIAFPTALQFGEFYNRWRESLVGALNWKYSRADREDAVQHAFIKLMFEKKSEDYARVPSTERDWYGNLLWQAKAYLSHLAGSRKIWDAHHKNAYRKGCLTSGTGAYCTIDDEVRAQALWETLYALCKEDKMSEKLVDACIRWWLNDEASSDVERETGIKANYLYQLRYRISARLSQKGPKRFREIRRRIFIQAA